MKNRGFFAGFIFLIILMMIRATYGIELTDEAYYIAEGKTVFEGNIPYAYNNSATVGMTIIMTPFIYLYANLVPNYEGFFLYMRFCYIFFHAGVLLLCFFILKAKIDEFYAGAGISSVIIVTCVASLLNFSYNSISGLMILATGVVLFFVLYNETRIMMQILGGYLAGIFSALGVFAHPASAICVLGFSTVLICFKNVRLLLFYIAGGISCVMICFGWFIYQSDIGVFQQGLLELINNLSGQDKPMVNTVICNIVNSYWRLWLIMMVSMPLVALYMYAFYKRKNINFNNKVTVIYVLYVALLLGGGYILWQFRPEETTSALGAAIAFDVVILMMFFYKHKAVWLLGGQPILFALFEAFGSVTGSPASRFAFAVPSALSIFIVSSSVLKNEKLTIEDALGKKCKVLRKFKTICSKRISKALIITTLIIIVVCELNSLRYVYRDDGFFTLNYRAQHGIYKGIYSTKQRIDDVWEFEQYIKSITDKDDYVSFRDNVPVGYLMTNGNACDIRTWDCMQFSYKGRENNIFKNDPSELYAYYKRRGKTPDKIIYVDFGRDKYLSMDDKLYRYNEFLYNNYELSTDVFLNETFKRVVVFRKKEKNDSV